MNAVFFAVLRRDLRLSLRGGGGAMTCIFFVLAMILTPLATGAREEILTMIGSATLWICALLSLLLAMEKLFQADFEDGSLDLLILSGLALEMIVLAKTIAFMISVILPVLLITPLMGAMLALDFSQILRIEAALALAMPALAMQGALGAALVVSVTRSGLLLALLVLPLYIPLLIFGTSVAWQNAPAQSLLILACLALASVFLCPIGAAAALRASL